MLEIMAFPLCELRGRISTYQFLLGYQILVLSSSCGASRDIISLSSAFMISSALFRLTLLLVEPTTSLELILEGAIVA
jgi:hypothetical protein